MRGDADAGYAERRLPPPAPTGPVRGPQGPDAGAGDRDGVRGRHLGGRPGRGPGHVGGDTLNGAADAAQAWVRRATWTLAELAQKLLAARGGVSGVESRTRDAHGDLMTAVALCLWAQGLVRV